MKEEFLKACKGVRPQYTPVWFMRQAGRYLPEYQKIRQKYDFLTMCKTPEIAAQITLQPVKILGVDAAILFSDILIPLEAVGLKVDFTEDKGPTVTPQIKTTSDLNKLKTFDIECLNFVFETIKILIKELDVPLIGFSASPFTLATYMIEGGSSRDFFNTKRFLFSEIEGFKKLMEVITDFTILYLKEQIKSGVHVIQIFDTWAGILSPEDYGIFCKPYIQRIISVLKPYVPIIYFTSNSAGLLNHLKDLEWDVISLDWKVEIKDALKFLKNRVIQGNLDPFTILADLDIVFDKAKKVLIQAAEAKAHIFNFGHGVNVNTSVDKLKKLVDFVHNYRV